MAPSFGCAPRCGRSASPLQRRPPALPYPLAGDQPRGAGYAALTPWGRRPGGVSVARVMSAAADREAPSKADDIGPAATVAALDEREIAVLRDVGQQWGRALNGRRTGLSVLPVDPG